MHQQVVQNILSTKNEKKTINYRKTENSILLEKNIWQHTKRKMKNQNENRKSAEKHAIFQMEHDKNEICYYSPKLCECVSYIAFVQQISLAKRFAFCCIISLLIFTKNQIFYKLTIDQTSKLIQKSFLPIKISKFVIS